MIISNPCKDVEKLDFSNIFGENLKWYNLSRKLFIITKWNMRLPFYQGIIPLSSYPGEMKTYVHTNTCSHIFTAVLLETTQTSFYRWMADQVLVQTKEYCSAFKRNKLLIYAMIRWVGYKSIMLLEKSQFQKKLYTVWFHCRNILEIIIIIKL